MAACPACDADDLEVDEFDVEEGDIVNCPECGASLVVNSLSPLEFETADDEDEDDDDEDEDEEEEDDDDEDDLDEDDEEDEREDWGEEHVAGRRDAPRCARARGRACAPRPLRRLRFGARRLQWRRGLRISRLD